jgi:hypothetical protein
VYYRAASQAFPSGNKVVYGEHGKVVGPVCGTEVAVLFPDNKGALDCPVTQLSRKWPPPPLAGSLNVNDTVYFNAGAVSFTDGDRVEPGHKGKVTGPHPSKPAKVMVRFAGNKGIISCFATDVSRCWPPKPAASPTSPTQQQSGWFGKAPRDSSSDPSGRDSSRRPDTIFDTIDTDMSGTIEDFELLVHMVELGADQQSIDLLFKSLDVDGDGHISRDEWHQGFHHYSQLLQTKENRPFVMFVASLGGAAARAATAIQSRWRGTVCRRAARLLAASFKAGASSPTRQSSGLARRSSLGGATDPLRIFERRPPVVKKKPPVSLATAHAAGRSSGMGLSVADEVAKLKQLLDSGALTAEEYEEAKRRELNRR